MKELIKAILTQAKASSAVYDAVTSDFYYERVPPAGNVAMPYIVYYLISQEKAGTFAGGRKDAIVQFTIYDDSPSPETILTVHSDLDLAFDRATLTFDSESPVSCEVSTKTGPTWFPDDNVWQITADYRIRRQ